MGTVIEKPAVKRKGPPSLSLDELKLGTGAITPNFGGVLAECAAVALESQSHSRSVRMRVAGAYRKTFVLNWEPATTQTRRCHGDEEVATEHGAYGIAILTLPELTGMTVVSRSRKGTGFDFWVGENGNCDLPFQAGGRLEVSGIRRGNQGIVKARLKQKLRQTTRSAKTSLTAFAFVVEFSRPITQVGRQ